MKLTLVTPLKKIVTDVEVDEVFVPGYRGELNILPGHADLITTLTTGILKYRETGASELKLAAISWGYCEVTANTVVVLAETAETPAEIDAVRAEQALRKAMDKLTGFDESSDLQKYQNKVNRAQTRLSVLSPGSDKIQ